MYLVNFALNGERNYYLQVQPGKGLGSRCLHFSPLQQHKRTKRMGIRYPQPHIFSITLLIQFPPPQQRSRMIISNQR